jgi:hypothetical protein
MIDPRARRARFGVALAATVLAMTGLPAIAASATTSATSLAPTTSTTNCGHGFSAVHITRAASFKPESATSTELAENFLPQRPTNADALKTWEHFVSNPIRSVASCSTLVPLVGSQPGGPSIGSSSSSGSYSADVSHNWAGNIAEDRDWTQAEGTWTVPLVSGPVESVSSQWVGLGLGTSSSEPLYQLGSTSDTDNSHNLWIEVFPEQTMQIKQSTAVGHVIWVLVTMTSTGANFEITDETNGWTATYKWTGVRDTPTHAEWIDERYTYEGGLPPFAKGNTAFTGAEAYSAATGWLTVGNTTHYDDNMYDCAGTLLASTGSITGTLKAAYTVTGVASGNADPSTCP